MQAKEKGLAMDSRSGPAGAASGLSRLLPREVKFILNRTRSLCFYLKVVLIRHQDFQHKVLYVINFFWVSFISQKNFDILIFPRRNLCIIAGWNQEVSEHQELVIRELLLVLLPVVVVGPPEIGQRFLHSHLPAQLGWSSVSQGPQLHTKTNVGHNCSVPPRVGADPEDGRALGNSAQEFNFHSSGYSFDQGHDYKKDSWTYNFELGNI